MSSVKMKLPKRFLWFELVPVNIPQPQARLTLHDHVFRLELIVSSFILCHHKQLLFDPNLSWHGLFTILRHVFSRIEHSLSQHDLKTISCQNTGSKVSGLLPAHARRKFSQISSELAVHLFLCLCIKQA